MALPTTPYLKSDVQKDIKAISAISVIPAILDVVCRTTGMGFVAVARVTDKQWLACAVLDNIGFGLKPGEELVLESTICNEIRQHHKPVVIDHVAKDQHFCKHHTPLQYGFQSYISIPIILQDGTFFGTLCAIDPNPAKLNNPETIGMFKLYADLISLHLHNHEQLQQVEANLVEEQETAELREQFIAILGHDLRNPVGAVRSAAQFLQSEGLKDTDVKMLAGILLNSSQRMLALIDNLMDFARGRLGTGITLDREHELLQKPLQHVMDELQLVWPDKNIHAHFELNKAIYCDSKRIAQLFSNLLSNALTHGSKDAPVNVLITADDNEFSLTVANSGKPIPEAAQKMLFQPFSRSTRSNKGLGLGLYIASEIANAHGGRIKVSSNEEQTVFTFTMPVRL